MNTIKIKCPTCGKVLIVQDAPGINNKSFICPVCKEKHILGKCRIAEKPRVTGEETEYTFNNQKPSTSEVTQYMSTTGAVAEKAPETNVQVKTCSLVDAGGKRYQLSSGINTIGRKASSSCATIQIEVDDCYMSRNHAVIDVRNVAGQIISIFKNGKNKNASMLNGNIVGETDQLILNAGDKIKLGETILTYEI